VTGFARRGASARSHHFIGVQVAEAEAFASVAPGQAAESLVHVYPQLVAARPGSVRVFVTEAAFHDIGTPGDYLTTSLRLGRGAPQRGARTRVDPSARVRESVLWDDVEVGAGASLDRCVVADGVRVPPATAWTGVVLRRADGPPAPGDRRVGDLAVAAI
jgi:NDP-sugar pyrophosphorylase family protein